MLLISLITAAQVILIIKIWMMTSDVRKIRQKLNEPQAEKPQNNRSTVKSSGRKNRRSLYLI